MLRTGLLWGARRPHHHPLARIFTIGKTGESTCAFLGYNNAMQISPGTKLGPYEILSPLGVGGMGEVFRARDTRLGREVALKILPAEFASHQERLTRFEQEARSASALNHPNIITVYDVGNANSTFYIAMELVDGKSLREILE